MRGAAEQVIAPKRETATLLKTLRVESKLVAGGFALGELRRYVLSIINLGRFMDYLSNVQKEFETVDILLGSETKTGRTDAFILSWVKVEKQIRKLFHYIVFQFPAFSSSHKRDIINVFVPYRNLYLDNYISGFNAIYPETFQQIVGGTYDELRPQLNEIKRKYRNKILHGQLTGQGLDAEQLSEQVEIMRNWITLIAEKFSLKIDYDGLESKAFRKSEKPDFTSHFRVEIKNIDELKNFIEHSMGGRI